MRDEILTILKKHEVSLFDLVQKDLFTFTLRTLIPASTTLMRELSEAIPKIFVLENELIEPPEPKELLRPRCIQAPLILGDNVNHPVHYNTGKIEVIEFIEDKKLNFNRGNAVKYIVRAGKKDPAKELEDLGKAIWYLNREIELIKALDDDREPARPNDMKKHEAYGNT